MQMQNLESVSCLLRVEAAVASVGLYWPVIGLIKRKSEGVLRAPNMTWFLRLGTARNVFILA